MEDVRRGGPLRPAVAASQARPAPPRAAPGRARERPPWPTCRPGRSPPSGWWRRIGWPPSRSSWPGSPRARWASAGAAHRRGQHEQQHREVREAVERDHQSDSASLRRSTLPLAVIGNRSRKRTTRGSMYDGTRSPSRARSQSEPAPSESWRLALGDDERRQRVHLPVAQHRQDDRVVDALERTEVRLDVAELHAIAVQLHLVIAPAIEEHQAVLDVPDVAGAGTRAGRCTSAKRSAVSSGRPRYPGLTLSPAITISPRWPSASGTSPAFGSHEHRRSGLGVADRQHRMPRKQVRRHLHRRGDDGRFGGTVHVPDLCAREPARSAAARFPARASRRRTGTGERRAASAGRTAALPGRAARTRAWTPRR